VPALKQRLTQSDPSFDQISAPDTYLRTTPNNPDGEKRREAERKRICILFRSGTVSDEITEVSVKRGAEMRGIDFQATIDAIRRWRKRGNESGSMRRSRMN
jgi:hypothetical protein